MTRHRPTCRIQPVSSIAVHDPRSRFTIACAPPRPPHPPTPTQAATSCTYPQASLSRKVFRNRNDFRITLRDTKIRRARDTKIQEARDIKISEARQQETKSNARIQAKGNCPIPHAPRIRKNVASPHAPAATNFRLESDPRTTDSHRHLKTLQGTAATTASHQSTVKHLRPFVTSTFVVLGQSGMEIEILIIGNHFKHRK